jgi:hypothetical protein
MSAEQDLPSGLDLQYECFVTVLTGRHKGRTGYLGDWESSDEGVVFFGDPLDQEDHAVLPLVSLREATEWERAVYRRLLRKLRDEALRSEG